MELVRISTAGSVDDGKSTLIGRLLYDNNALTVEQEELVQKKTREKGLADLDLSVITDGLVAEREQGITIDVANIYFSTKTHKFIIADSPGHLEYTRNMVTGASNAEMSVILVDARKGLLEQSYRHFFISHLLRLDKVIFCVNKMDLVDYSEDKFLEIAIAIQQMVGGLDEKMDYTIIPISSLKGDNVVRSSENMSWYKGETLNHILHSPKTSLQAAQNFRFDVQQVFHAQTAEFTDYRAFAGRVISGSVSVGDKITVLPSKKESTITEIRRFTDTLESAVAGDSVAISLADELDGSRGSLFTTGQLPEEKQEISATLVWMDEKAAGTGTKMLLKTNSREFAVRIEELIAAIDPVNPNTVLAIEKLELNSIAKVRIKLSQPAYFDAYSENKKNGVFILIDPQTNQTAALGFVE